MPRRRRPEPILVCPTIQSHYAETMTRTYATNVTARTVMIADGPPLPRTASVIDFRDPSHVKKRVGWFHTNRKVFNAGMYDGSCHPWRVLPQEGTACCRD